MVSELMLEKFKKIYLDKYHVTLTNKEALEMANPLLNLIALLVKPESPKVTDTSSISEGGKDEHQSV